MISAIKLKLNLYMQLV